MKHLRIPIRFKLFGTTYNVVWDNRRMNDKGCYGLSDYGSSEITLSTTQGEAPLSKDKILDTWYHERTHAILDMMHENELSSNEKFVDTFSKLLRQADESAEFFPDINDEKPTIDISNISDLIK